MSQERSVRLSFLRAILRFASWLYSMGVRVRNATFDWGLRRVHRLSVPVIAVGNLTTGGTGKTPIVMRLVELAQRRGRTPAILTRGYRRSSDPSGSSDEVRLLERHLPGVAVVVDADRVAGGRRAIEQGADLLILDDGFQHRRLARTFDLVLLDARDPFGGDAMLPRGLLREPVSGLRRAHGVIFTRADRVSRDVRRRRAETVASLAKREVPIAFEKHAPDRLVNLSGEREQAIDELRDRQVIAFSGIGDPDTLRETLEGCGARVIATLDFGDHHEFGPGDFAAIDTLVANHPDAIVVTTEKDAMRLDRYQPRGVTWILRIRARGCDDDERDSLDPFLERVIDSASRYR